MPHAIRKWLRRAQVRVVMVLHAGAQPVRAARRALDPNLRHAQTRTQREIATGLGVAGLLTATAFVVGIGFGNWIAFVALLVGFGIEAALLAWRARSARGRAEGWPAGRLDFGPEAFSQEDFIADGIDRYGPVFKTNFFGTPMVCVADLGQGTALLRDHAADLGPAWAPYDEWVPGGSPRGADGPRHAELRRFFARALTPALVQSWEPVFARSVSDRLGALAAASATGAGRVGPRDAVRELTLAAWSELFLGITPADPAYDEVRVLVPELDPDRRLYTRPLRDPEAALDRLAVIVQDAAGHRDRTELAATLADRFAASDPDGLAGLGVMRNLLTTMITTSDDVAGLLLWVLWYLARDAVWAEQLRADPDEAAALADRIVSETLRLHQSEFVMRRAQREIRTHDVVVPADWFVRVCIREIHRDPARFEHAERFAPERFRDGGCGRDVYAPFGVDHRSCLGEVLTRSIARVFVLVVTAGFDVETVDDGPVELSRERHWTPSSQWRIAVRARPSR